MSRKKYQGPRGGADGAYGAFKPNPANGRNMTTEMMYVRQLTELSMNRFKWIGLPDTVDERFLEATLFQNALCVFYFDKDVDRYLALRAAAKGQPNWYDNPTNFNVIGGRINKHLGPRECVPIWANRMRIPDHDIVYLYANRLAQADRTIDINLMTQRHTQFLFVDEDERQSAVAVMRQVSEGQPMVFGTRSLQGMMERIQAFNLQLHPDTVTKMQDARNKLWNEAMTLLGINNGNQDKRERLVAAEVSANDEQVLANRNVGLTARAYACEQINRMFGLSVSVTWNNAADAEVLQAPTVLPGQATMPMIDGGN